MERVYEIVCFALEIMVMTVRKRRRFFIEPECCE